MSTIGRRLGHLEPQITPIANAMNKKKVTGLDIGLKECRAGKVHKYKSVKALVSDVWADYKGAEMVYKPAFSDQTQDGLVYRKKQKA